MNNILEKIGKAVLVVVGVPAIIAIAGIILAIPVYFLWNWLMPQIFEITKITFWQAWGIVFLSSLLFKSTNSK